MDSWIHTRVKGATRFMICETEWRRVVGSKTLIRLPKTSTRKCHVTWVRLLERVDQNLRVYGCQAWIGPLYRAGGYVEESVLYAGREHPPVLLENTQAEPLERGSRTPRGRWRQLFILWQWNPQMGEWRELGRCEDFPLDFAPDLRQLARRALQQELWRDTESAEEAGDRIHQLLQSEWSQLGDKRSLVVSIVYSLLCTMMLLENEKVLDSTSQPVRGVRPVRHRRRSSAV
jgi:hypothetical protein